MRHKVSGRKFDRAGDERAALLRGLVTDLLRHECMRTTVAKAKEARPIAEKMITLGKHGTVHARRQALAYMNDKDVVKKLFDEIAPRFAERPGGYTRMLRLGYRRGDSAEVAEVEILGSEYDPSRAAEADKAAAAGGDKPKKTVGGRIREALTGGRKKADDQASKGKVDKKGAGKKITTPRKAGGS